MRRRQNLFVITALVAAIAILSAVLLWPTLRLPTVTRSENPLGLMALACLVVALVLGGRALWRWPHWTWLAVLAAAGLFIPFAVVKRAFGSFDIGAFFFHTWAGMTGAGPAMFKREITVVLVAFALLFLALHLLSGVMRHPARLLLPVALALVVTNPAWPLAWAYVAFSEPQLQLARDLHWPDPAAPGPDPAPDIVHVYLEGLDRRFLDPAIGGDSYAPLTELALTGITLTDVRGTAGTSWSIAGIAASQCGVPLASPLVYSGIRHNRTTAELTGPFLPGATCLTDVLNAHGYETVFLVGGRVDFAGIDNFLTSHGYDLVQDMGWITTSMPADQLAAAATAWGVDDQMTYGVGRATLADLMTRPAPFYLAIETIGPHGMTGFLSRDCNGTGLAATSEDPAATVACLTAATRDFVADIRRLHQASGRPNPLRIVLQSDHLHHGRDFLVTDEALNRNTVILLDGLPGRSIDRPGAMMDVYPTLLDWLGFADATPVRAGLGLSLLAQTSDETLVQRHDPALLDDALIRSRLLFDALWHPTATPP